MGRRRSCERAKGASKGPMEGCDCGRREVEGLQLANCGNEASGSRLRAGLGYHTMQDIGESSGMGKGRVLSM